MVDVQELWRYCDRLLDVGSYQDYCPNGLQVQGRRTVERIVCGVSASQALLDEAVRRRADLILVHHGYFWKGEEACIRGMKWQRIKTLLAHDINLLAYHLPLDGHAELGNNACLARRWGVRIEGRFGDGPHGGIAMYGSLPQAIAAKALAERIAKDLGREPLWIDGGNGPVRRIGWCSGAAQDYLDQAAELGLDAFVSGEITERTVHGAREMGIHYLAAGHHATERYGIAALGEHLAEHFSLQCEVVEIDNPV